MNSIAFVFKNAPHGSASGREGLDALLATSALTDDIGVFFLGDGVFHLLTNQQPQKIHAKDYISTLKLLELYDIEAVYACRQSMESRGLVNIKELSIQVQQHSASSIRQLLERFDKIITF